MIFVSKLITPLQLQIPHYMLTELAILPLYPVILPCFELPTYAITLYMGCLNFLFSFVWEQHLQVKNNVPQFEMAADRRSRRPINTGPLQKRA